MTNRDVVRGRCFHCRSGDDHESETFFRCGSEDCSAVLCKLKSAEDASRKEQIKVSWAGNEARFRREDDLRVLLLRSSR